MIRNPAMIRKTTHIIASAADETTLAYNKGRVQDETTFTGSLITKIEEKINGLEINQFKWEAMTLIPQSQEKIYGADFLGVLTVDISDCKLSKGFLVQAKMEKNLKIKELKEQCDKMLQISPDSFVFVYNEEGVKIYPAISVLNSEKPPLKLFHRTPAGFYELHFESFIGDRKLSAPNISVLEEIRRENEEKLEKVRREFDAKSVLYLKATSKNH